MNPTPLNEWPERAFRLAYFLHGERETAVHIAARALNKLQLAANAQGKRLYYRLTGRADARKSRSKISVSEPHLLQRLVYVESEEFERDREQASQSSPPSKSKPARHSDMVVYFIKHLVRITTKRNSFYVTLGLSRLLYNYSTPETMELYNLIIQDPDRVHDDYYYRSRKGLLLKEIKDRFGALLEVTKGARGEQRWHADEDTQRFAGLAHECLLWFTPWETPCVVPERFDPLNDTINNLNFTGRHPDEEHEVEVNRLHAALHPECFARLAAASGFAAPDERLELPHFFVSDDHDGPNGSERTPPNLSADDLRAINDLLAHEATRRKATSASFFRVLVDGIERAETEDGQSTTQLRIDEGAEVIEVYGKDQEGSLLLATYLLNFNGTDVQSSVITVEGGQQITFATKLLRDEAGVISGVDVIVACKETARLRTALLSARGMFDSLMGRPALTPRVWWKPAAAFVMLILFCAGAWWYWSSGQKPHREIVFVAPTPGPTAAPTSAPTASELPAPKSSSTPAKSASPDKRIPPLVQVAKSGTSHEPKQSFVERSVVPDDTFKNGTATDTGANPRGGWDRQVMGKPLGEVRRVYVQTVTDSPPSQVLLEELRLGLTGGGKLQFSESADADAALKISVRRASDRADDQRVIAIVRVVNANGYVVWPVSRRGSSMRYVGRPRYVAERVLTDVMKSVNAVRLAK
ncbi:MAG TPA: hypothetical protein VGQ39_04335 [Pyrinomonadaceae bacterium]|nr:hypothetical protein [Pyrinomonadaceae bacterium]